MISSRLKPFALLLPILFIAGVLLFVVLMDPELELGQVRPIFVLLSAGAVAFTLWIFGLLEKREALVSHRSEQLAALHKASLGLTQALDLEVVLQQVVDQARELAGAQYGALAVLHPDEPVIDQFIVTGITPGQRERMGQLPVGKGLLGLLIHSGESVRVADIASDPLSVGFPPNHPAMKSLLGVPIRLKGEVLGDLYLTNKLSSSGLVEDFSDQDLQLLDMFAAQAAIVITNARLYRQSQQLTVFQERERIGMDLHDGVIQSIYAVGLNLENIQYRLEPDPQMVKPALVQAIDGLNVVIRDIRNYILDLRPQRLQGRDLAEGLAELARELRVHSFLSVEVAIETETWRRLSPEQTVEMLYIAREALTNIRKHAHASQVDIILTGRPGELALAIEDNGTGIDLERAAGGDGNGLRNMRERALALGASIEISPRESDGTVVELVIPNPG